MSKDVRIGEPGESTSRGGGDRLGVLHLEKNVTSHFKRKSKKTEKTNLTRGRLTEDDKKAFKFADIVPMNTDWQKYFRERLGNHFSSTKIEKTILKSDYHGALLTIWLAENPTQIGISGIVVLETRHTFQMVTQEDRFVVIPKKGSVFRFILGDRLFSLFGDGMRTRPAWRGKKPRIKRLLPTFIRGTLQTVPTVSTKD
ncbi:Ribonuclease P protein subunit p29 [Caenorhabditis elegans]|uniref:Ribonuclease P protein subunit p29 n=1 Tax=Caenorhabditis elegans TaxID=6239 RepID=Q9XVT1_CAEEL|nr:Ribonuclease P protein subunit p29 [Caenorhabditis elegans]CAB02730.1 Ribonuclease P protein subunit p29 [Caenorhabditis elegans]|eukprot:NP_493083.1 Ribonuclease P protein subunit p29 [Caenorhabditis elegans]